MHKILHFLPDNHVWGGIETYLNHTLPLLQAGGRYEVVAAVSKGGKLAAALKAQGIAVREIPLHIKTPFLRLLDIRPMLGLMKILKEESPDLVHIHKGRVEQAVIRLAGYPIVYTYHGYGGPNNLENAPNALLRNIYACTRPLLMALAPYLSGMIIVSHYERQRLYREGFLPRPFHAEVLHNGLPIKKMQNTVKDVDGLSVREELGLLPEQARNTRIVFFASRLNPAKNAAAFLRIAKMVLKNPALKKPVYFVVAGNGVLAERFQNVFSQDPLLSKHGCYLGFRQDIPRLLKAADLSVSLSLSEGFGLMVLESMLLGKPCLTYAAGGIPEVMGLSEAKDWLIPLGDETRFAEQLVEMINLPDSAFEKLSPILKEHSKRFDISRHVAGLTDFYDRTLIKLGDALPEAWQNKVQEPSKSSPTETKRVVNTAR